MTASTRSGESRKSGATRLTKRTICGGALGGGGSGRSRHLRRGLRRGSRQRRVRFRWAKTRRRVTPRRADRARHVLRLHEPLLRRGGKQVRRLDVVAFDSPGVRQHPGEVELRLGVAVARRTAVRLGRGDRIARHAVAMLVRQTLPGASEAPATARRSLAPAAVWQDEAASREKAMAAAPRPGHSARAPTPLHTTSASASRAAWGRPASGRRTHVSASPAFATDAHCNDSCLLWIAYARDRAGTTWTTTGHSQTLALPPGATRSRAFSRPAGSGTGPRTPKAAGGLFPRLADGSEARARRQSPRFATAALARIELPAQGTFPEGSRAKAEAMDERLEQISAAIAALEAQRAALGDSVVEIALAPLRRELAAQAATRIRSAAAA